MILLRDEFKMQAQQNEQNLKSILEKDFDDFWRLIALCNLRINICFKNAYDDEKRYFLVLMLLNSMSDLLCIIDGLERGHTQTVNNNLRMVLEHFCVVFHIYKDKEDVIFFAYKNNEHDVPKSITYCQKNYEGADKIGQIYGLLSAVTHQSNSALVVRQIDQKLMVHYHLKPIDAINFKNQANILLMTLILARMLAELAEEICIDIIEEPYFGEKADGIFIKKMNIPENEFIYSFSLKLNRFK